MTHTKTRAVRYTDRGTSLAPDCCGEWVRYGDYVSLEKELHAAQSLKARETVKAQAQDNTIMRLRSEMSKMERRVEEKDKTIANLKQIIRNFVETHRPEIDVTPQESPRRVIFPAGPEITSTEENPRDRFAGLALQGMLAHPKRYRPKDKTVPWHTAIAREAYELADAMLAACWEGEQND